MISRPEISSEGKEQSRTDVKDPATTADNDFEDVISVFHLIATTSILYLVKKKSTLKTNSSNRLFRICRIGA